MRAVMRSGELWFLPTVENVRTTCGRLRVSKGARLTYYRVNVPDSEWRETLPNIGEGLIQAAASEASTLVYCDNLYTYGRSRRPIAQSCEDGLVRSLPLGIIEQKDTPQDGL